MNLYGDTSKGKVRKTNQDSFFTAFDGDRALFVVCDGMGGESYGDLASQTTIKEFEKKELMRDLAKVKTLREARSIIRCAVRNANTAIYKMAQQDDIYKGMGTTCVIAYVIGKDILFMNVGDSRGYIINQSGAHQITIDHSIVEEMVRTGAITREEAKTYRGKNIITMAIGTDENILPDYFTYELRSGDSVLLCSDGLTNMIEDKNIVEIVQKNLSAKTCCEKLVETAEENGGIDNITAVIYKY